MPKQRHDKIFGFLHLNLSGYDSRGPMSFKQTIEILSRGSAQAVSTQNPKQSDAYKLKKYLYVKTPVEKALHRALDESDCQQIIFLCGSSGDGKSEIFSHIPRKYSSTFDFHLDATHSYDPGKNAIQTLNDKFKDHKASTQSLIVGINIGMLGNFAAEGDETHADIKTSIKYFLAGDNIANETHRFINFEDYPKFELKGDDIKAPFVGPLLNRICAQVEKNPLYAQSTKDPRNKHLRRNYRLLCIPEVQQCICSLLFYAHVKFDQFLTARTILDFVYQIVSGKGSLFDNLFCGQGTELFDSLRMLDPCHTRSKSLDLFQVKASLNLFEDDFGVFKEHIEQKYEPRLTESRSWVRLFYVLQHMDISNNYHHRFREDLTRDLFGEFQRVWQLHRDYDGDAQTKAELRQFYKRTFLSAVTRFVNRFAPEVRQERFLLGTRNDYAMSADSAIQPDLIRLMGQKPRTLRSFDVYLRIGNDKHIRPFPVSVSFLELVRKINDGYRPNTHDKTTVMTLEELVDEVRCHVRQTKRLHLQFQDRKWVLTLDDMEDEILVERQ
jgi:DNA phosphorothioation-dependent restriction protein DptF